MRKYPITVSVFYGEDGPNVHITRWQHGKERPQARTYHRPSNIKLLMDVLNDLVWFCSARIGALLSYGYVVVVWPKTHGKEL